ncbi:hypothetical protein QL093DRAFT_2077211 [Fusarium oxysporum]|nr:hypothetical protein QL093DRAFT_2077211 [Fusarium oxysporum]
MEMHNLCLLLFSNISDRHASTLDALDLRIDPLGQTLSVMLRIISLASTNHEVVTLREAAGVIGEHINANPAIVTEKIANAGAFGSIPMPSFKLYKIPRTMFVKVSADIRPVDEVIVIPFEGSDFIPWRNGRNKLGPAGAFACRSPWLTSSKSWYFQHLYRNIQLVFEYFVSMNNFIVDSLTCVALSDSEIKIFFGKHCDLVLETEIQGWVMIVTVILATDPSRSDGTSRPTQRRDTLSDFTDTDEIVE